jgi:ABC-type multidrug transport system ATPase subunit
LTGLAAAQRAALAEPDGSVAALLLEGVVLRLQADLRWLEACARYWNATNGRIMNVNESLSRVGPVLRARVGEGLRPGRGRALDGVELEVASCETVAVMGPSGCGKSTLLHLLGGLERPTAGEVWLAGRRVDQLSEKALARLRRQAIGFVFQAFHLMDEPTAVENVELPALLAGRSPRAARRRSAELLDRVGLTDRPTSRVALVRSS